MTRRVTYSDSDDEEVCENMHPKEKPTIKLK